MSDNGIRFDLRSDIREVERMFSRLQREQTPFAASVAINNLLFRALDEEKKAMRASFDRPTRYTLNALRYLKATKKNLDGRIWVKSKSDAGKGTSPENFLLPNIRGGERKAKRFEVALRRIGILPPGWLTVPGNGAQLDAFGNMSRGQIVQILSWFEAFGEQGYRANATSATRAKLKRGTKRKRGVAYFASIPARERTRHLPPGIYQKVQSAFGVGLKLVILFVRTASYRAEYFDFYGSADRYVRKHFPAEFEAQMRRAIATSR